MSKYSILLLSAVLIILSVQTASAAQTFQSWVQSFKAEALQKGISKSTVNDAFVNVKYKPRVIELDRKQPEGTMTFTKYRQRIVSDLRVQQGRKKYRENKELLEVVSAKYGVQPQYIVALWGIETNYGSNTGGFQIMDALATLAYEGRRRTFFKKELINALKIVDMGHITARAMKGSWAGAMGQSQFMPSSFLSYAQDYDKDGRKDIWTTKADVFASVANYLSRSGWRGDERWGRHVRLPSSIPASMIGLKKKSQTVNEWSRLGVRQINGMALPNASIKANLVQPGGANGPTYLVYRNYKTIMKWNRSTYFATSVGLLADRIAAGMN